MHGQIVMVTGANSGIGKETALGLARDGATVVMVCRDKARGEAAQHEIQRLSGNTAVDLLLADLSSLEEVRRLVAQFKQKYEHLHGLVNNAGGVFLQRQLSVDNIEKTYAVNYFSAFLLTNLLLDRLKASTPARIINVSSAAHLNGHIDLSDFRFEHEKYSIMQAYANSKLAMILFTYELARRLEGTEVTANCLHPGVVATNIWAQPLPSFLHFLSGISRLFGVSAEQGARTSLYLATSPAVEGVSGKYFENCKERSSSTLSYDRELQRHLWEVSARLTGVSAEI
ncbi:SDR family oxidoreductase [Ktedonosporobacter rubrisoli]|uniref:SDR family oxidoreductase n=1 Tax=Ktedonosporobacter rubrisoli TaxID=2509675 RepID=A0A4P6JHV4_KTERU|nr:SDR family oxidoreductase [Ktedonosporobacter rubrisoli]QBD74619.1 SDR family oxidoreductase [Ktedonosporobacter rubrisoli]